MRQWTEDEILQQDLERIAADDSIDWEKLRGARILVTGATGLIGGLVAKALIAAGEARDLKLHVLAVVRSKEKAKQQLSAFPGIWTGADRRGCPLAASGGRVGRLYLPRSECDSFEGFRGASGGDNSDDIKRDRASAGAGARKAGKRNGLPFVYGSLWRGRSGTL